jgi:hypothetical protein
MSTSNKTGIILYINSSFTKANNLIEKRSILNPTYTERNKDQTNDKLDTEASEITNY